MCSSDLASQLASWCIGSLINRSKSGRLRPARKGRKGVVEVVPMVILLVVVPTLGPGAPLALGPGPDIVKVTGGEPERKREPNESEEESECRLEGGLARRRRDGASQKLRVKAKKSPGSAPWGCNDDNKNMAQGEEE